MPKKINRSERQSTSSTLYRSRKVIPPQKSKSERISTTSVSAKEIKVKCEWQKAAAANALDSYKYTYSALPKDVTDAIKPIYEDLIKDALLERSIRESWLVKVRTYYVCHWLFDILV